jgi:hypothetical protein
VQAFVDAAADVGNGIYFVERAGEERLVEILDHQVVGDEEHCYSLMSVTPTRDGKDFQENVPK